jgi:hypothetical protein
VGIALFLLGIAAVGWGRWYFIQGVILEKLILQGRGLEWTDIFQFTGAMLGNVIVYLLGVWWSFAKHDSVPEFSELRHRLEELETRKLHLFERLLTSRNQQHILNAQHIVDQLRNRESAQQKGLDGYNTARQSFAGIQRKDTEVVAMLNDYKLRLIKRIKNGKASPRFRIEDIQQAELEAERFLSVDQFSGSPLKLPCL